MAVVTHPPDTQTTPVVHPPKTWGPPAFVWGTWVLLLATGLLLVANYHHCTPLWPGDDWTRCFSWIAGTRPWTVKELWQPEFEHRLLMIQVVAPALLKLSAGDYWSIGLFDVLCMSVLSFAFLRAAAGMRGYTRYTDALLPMSVCVGLFTGNLFYGNWLTYFAEAWVAGGVFAVMVRRGTRLTLGSGIVAGILLLLLPAGIGAGGPLYFPILFVWLVYSAVTSRRAGILRGWQCLVILALAAVALAVMGLYFYHLDFGEHPVARPSLAASVTTAVAWFTGSLGPVALNLWPFSGPPTVLLLLGTAAALAVTLWRGDARTRSRALGLACYLAAVSMFGLGFAWGRAGATGPQAGLWYWPLATTVVPCFYFAWELCLPWTAAQFAQMCLLVVVCFTVSQDASLGLADLRKNYEGAQRVEEDIRAGVPPYVLLGHHHAVLGVLDPGNYLTLQQLHANGFGIFKYLGEDPPFRELEPLPLTPAAVHEATWDGATTTATGTGPESYVAFSLPEPMLVASIHVKSSVFFGMRITWGKGAGSDFVEKGSWAALPYDSGGMDAVIYVGDTIDRIRFYIDANTVKVSEIVPKVPDTRG